MRLDRRAEWKQIFDEAWRMMRDNFYDPTMRGVDWPAMKRRYEAELPYVALRSDLNFLVGEMNAELGVSHISASGGDTPETRRTAAVSSAPTLKSRTVSIASAASTAATMRCPRRGRRWRSRGWRCGRASTSSP